MAVLSHIRKGAVITLYIHVYDKLVGITAWASRELL